MRIGCDLVYLPRIKPGLEKAILTELEQEELSASPKPKEFIGGRFALKEAFMKSMGKGIDSIGFRSIEVRKESGGAPYIVYQGKRYECSLSHDGDYAFAVAIYED